MCRLVLVSAGWGWDLDGEVEVDGTGLRSAKARCRLGRSSFLANLKELLDGRWLKSCSFTPGALNSQRDPPSHHTLATRHTISAATFRAVTSLLFSFSSLLIRSSPAREYRQCLNCDDSWYAERPGFGRAGAPFSTGVLSSTIASGRRRRWKWTVEKR